ncbi:MAG: uracil-DNA glycosylase [Acutalibacteraceae bacterium]
MVCLNNSWDELLKDDFNSAHYKKLREFLKKEYFTKVIYPPMGDIFNALKYTDFDNVKAVILGQDPYHGKGQAHGLCFSVKKGIKPPPSLINIYKEQKTDLGIDQPMNNGDLTKWAEQGVLLLNTVLTVREGSPNSHKGMGWEEITDKVIELLNKREKPVVFILWGANSRAKKKLITNPNHLIIESAHPSPLSAYNGFFGSKPFSRTNEFLIKTGQSPIDWQL